MIEKIRQVEQAWGSGEKLVLPVEQELRAFARRSIFAVRDIAAGERLTENNDMRLIWLYNILTMYVDTSTVRSSTGKTYTRHLLRESYRKEGKVKHHTIGNLSSCSPEEIEAIRLALRHKRALTSLVSLKDDLRLEQGLSVGAV